MHDMMIRVMMMLMTVMTTMMMMVMRRNRIMIHDGNDAGCFLMIVNC